MHTILLLITLQSIIAVLLWSTYAGSLQVQEGRPYHLAREKLAMSEEKIKKNSTKRYLSHPVKRCGAFLPSVSFSFFSFFLFSFFLFPFSFFLFPFSFFLFPFSFSISNLQFSFFSFLLFLLCLLFSWWGLFLHLCVGSIWSDFWKKKKIVLYWDHLVYCERLLNKILLLTIIKQL